MKKYKLIQWYPSLGDYVDVGITASLYRESRENIDKDDKNYHNYKTANDYIVPYREVENYPEFWEEVVEKDYEILAFTDTDENCILTKREGQNSYGNTGCSAEILSHKANDHIIIHSVRRLSDGEVFNIGDRVRISKLQHDGSFIIDEFYFDCNGDKLLCNGKCTGNGHVSITKIEHSKFPLFTTEDGVNIFENDMYFYTNSTFGCYEEIAIKGFNYNRPSNKRRFSTEEAAKKYILMNKPCLSINEVLNLRIGFEIYSGTLIKFLKSKGL